MTPRDAWSDQRLDDLASQVRTVAALSTLVATHDAKIDGVEDDIAAIRESQREAIRDVSAAVQAIGASCNANTLRIENKIDEQVKARTFGPAAKATIIAAVIGANGAIIAALAGVLHP